MSFGPWQGAFRGVTRATRRIRVGGITLRRARRKPVGPDAPRGEGRRFRPKSTRGTESVVIAVLIFVPTAFLAAAATDGRALLSVIIASCVSAIPILFSSIPVWKKCLYLVPFVVLPVGLFLNG